MKYFVGLFISGMVAGVSLLGFISQVQAIDNVCKAPSQYQVQFQLVPASGTKDTSITVQMQFKWLSTNSTCLDNKLQFDLSVDGELIEEYEIGKAPQGQWVTHTKTVRLVDFGIGVRPTVDFQFNVEGDDLTDEGDDLIGSNVIRTYTVKTSATTICAYIDPGDRKWACVTGSESATTCSSLPQCQGKSCQKIDAALCGTNSGSLPTVTTPGPTSQGSGYNFEIKNPLGGANDFTELIKKISQWLFNLSIPVAVAFIIYGGLQFLFAGANPELAMRGKKTLLYAVIGLAIVLIGYGFVTLVQSIIGLGASPAATAPPPQP